jgi:hypothetical protein
MFVYIIVFTIRIVIKTIYTLKKKLILLFLFIISKHNQTSQLKGKAYLKWINLFNNPTCSFSEHLLLRFTAW